MTRYDGNTGRYVRVPESAVSAPPAASAPLAPQQTEPGARPAAGQSRPARASPGGLGTPPAFDGLGKIFSKFLRPSFELEDLLLVGMFYLLYRESKDVEFLLMAGAILLL